MKELKIKIFLVIFIIVIFILAIFIIQKNNKRKEFNIEEVASIEYMLIKENNKWGVINKNGNIVVQPNYVEIDIPNPSKPVFICMYNYNTEKNEYSIKVLNEKNEQILYQYYIIEVIKLDWDTSEIPFEKSVLKYKQKGKYGLIDFNGNIITKPKYEEISSLKNQEGVLLVKKNGKYGLININGNCILKEKYDIIEANSKYSASNELEKMLFVVGNNGTDGTNGTKYGVVNSNGKKILDIKYEQIEIVTDSNNNNYFIAFENGKAGFYNSSRKIMPNIYEDIVFNENNNCLIVEKDQKQGVFGLNGQQNLRNKL